MKTENYQKINLKRKVFAKGKQNFKRFKRVPKYVKDNVENQVAREIERDAYHFTDSEEELDDLGMGLDISDLPFLDDNHNDKQKQLIALTQDAVRPLFIDEASYDEEKLKEGLTELRLKSFRPNQKETIKRILSGRSTLFISPTGSGKSLCYQLPALLYWRYRKYITIVVSPLISLMEDQMTHMPAALKAITLHSGHNIVQRRRSIEQLVNGEAQVAFISPEAIVGGLLNLEDLRNLPPVGFVCIDEAHCLSEWSHNFRPAYQQFFTILSEQMNIKTYLGLTATANKATSFAIAKNLTINPETDVIGCTKIPENLILSVSCENSKEMALIELLKSPTFRIMTSIIVYCNRREETEHVAARIRTAMQNYSTMIEVPERSKSTTANSKDDSIKSNDSNSSETPEKPHMKLSWNAECYHAGLSSDARKRIQRQFIKGEIRVVVATIAFGMGINKANVRAIIHYDMPSSFESYVQEIGRAGRDGKPAQCHMFLQADKNDLYYQQRNIYASVTEASNLKKLTDYLFKPPCRCAVLSGQSDSEKLARMNAMDPHRVRSWNGTTFRNTKQVHGDEDEEEEDDLDFIKCNDEQKLSEKENISSVKYVRESVIKKHRPCKGHELSFDLEQATTELNLKPEAIITLICQLQKTYPQLRIKQFTPIKPLCNLFCYRGPAQMEALAKSFLPVGYALSLHRKEHNKKSFVKYETPNRLSFNVVSVAKALGKPYTDVVRMLKKTEWELVEKTGRFRRSQVRVNFEGNAFHLQAVGDLNSEEIKEINEYLLDFTHFYEQVEREKVSRVYHTLKRHCIDLGKMKDKPVRLDASKRLKAALDAYFDHSIEVPSSIGAVNCVQLNETNATEGAADENQTKISELKEHNIRKSASDFVSAHGQDYTPRAIARIFQGISTPNYPAEIWGTNRKWWRIHTDVDFLLLTSIIKVELMRRTN